MDNQNKIKIEAAPSDELETFNKRNIKVEQDGRHCFSQNHEADVNKPTTSNYDIEMDRKISVKEEPSSSDTELPYVEYLDCTSVAKTLNSDSVTGSDCEMESETDFRMHTIISDITSEYKKFSVDRVLKIKKESLYYVDKDEGTITKREIDCLSNMPVPDISKAKGSNESGSGTAEDLLSLESSSWNAEVVSQVTALTHDEFIGKDESLREDSSELKEKRNSDSNITETFSLEESLFSGQQNGGKIISTGLIQHSNTYGSDSYKNDVTCKPSGKLHKCQVCERNFKKMSDLKQHNLMHEGIKPHKCEKCEKAFTRMSHLKQHNLIHDQIKPHKCEVCAKTFTDPSTLKRHIVIHKSVKPHKCEMCEKTFTQLASLKQHIWTHEGKKPHKCKICEKTFIRLSQLKQHNLLHEGIKPHKCGMCEKTFIDVSNLKQHILTHEDVKPYKCGMCEKTFNYSSSLKRHTWIHEGVKPFKCETCEKTFIELSKLKQHKLIHEGVKPHKCERCGLSFRHLVTLKRHILHHEKKKST